MTKEVFHEFFDKGGSFDLIFWDKTDVYKISSYTTKETPKESRLITVESIYNYKYDYISEENCDQFERIPSGEMKAVLHMAMKEIKRDLSNLIGGE